MIRQSVSDAVLRLRDRFRGTNPDDEVFEFTCSHPGCGGWVQVRDSDHRAASRHVRAAHGWTLNHSRQWISKDRHPTLGRHVSEWRCQAHS